jgi:dephospho-CoA kinase
LKSSHNHIFKIGVTGGIGSGKSVVCSLFAHLGIPVISADEISKYLSATDSAIRKKLIALIGQSAYQFDGSLNRSFIASEIFSHAFLRQKVESIIHPRVEKEIDRQIKELLYRGELIVIVEAALIYEAGLNKKLDTVVVVEADESERMNRVCKRDTVTEDAVRSRMNSQLDGKKKLENADYIIYNNGTMKELEFKVRFLYSIFKQLAEEGARV